MKFCLFDERAQGCRIVSVKESFREALDANDDGYVPSWVTILPLMTRTEFESKRESIRNEKEGLYYLHYEIPGYPRKFGQVIVVPDQLPGIKWTTGDRVLGIREKEGYVRRGVLLECDMRSGLYLFKSDYGSILQHQKHELFTKEFNPFHTGVEVFWHYEDRRFDGTIVREGVAGEGQALVYGYPIGIQKVQLSELSISRVDQLVSMERKSTSLEIECPVQNLPRDVRDLLREYRIINWKDAPSDSIRIEEDAAKIEAIRYVCATHNIVCETH